MEPLTTNEFALNNIIIGCRSPDLLTTLSAARIGWPNKAAGAASNTPNGTHPSTEVSAKPKPLTQAKVNLLRTVIFEMGKEVSYDYFNAILLPCDLEKYHNRGDIPSSCTVLSTTPFAKGKMTPETELVVILITDPPKADSFEKLVEAGQSSECSDFLKTYNSQTPGDNDKAIATPIIAVNIMEVGNDDLIKDINGHSSQRSDQVIYMNVVQASKFQLMTKECVRVKRHDKLKGDDDQKRPNDLKREWRVIPVIVVDESHPPLQMSHIAWYNLDGFESEIFGDKLVEIERMDSANSIVPHRGGVLSSASASHIKDHITPAEKILVACVTISDPISFNLSATSTLEEYLSTDRYLHVNDVFVLKIRPYSTNSYNKVLMKVLKIDGETDTTRCYIANTTSTFSETAPVKGFIPSGITNNRVKVGLSLKPARDTLRNLLKSFVKPKWNRNPLPFVILSGPEGCGKTLVATQIAKIFQCNLVEVNCINLVADGVITTEAQIKGVLMQAKEAAPTVLLLKNIESLTKDEALKEHNQRLSQYVTTQLTAITKESDWPILIIGTCQKLKNVCDDVREVALREITVQSPDLDERWNILEDLTEDLHLHTDVSLESVAEHTAGLLYGDLQALVAHAKRNSMTRAFEISKRQEEKQGQGSIGRWDITSSHLVVYAEDFEKGLDTIQGVQSLDLGTPKIPSVKWSDIGGLHNVKQDILDTIQLPLRHPELFISAMRRSGVLLYGPPGTGKTLLAKAVATECALNFFSVKGPELINMYVGQSEENVRQVFQKARSASPCVIFFDELDSLAPNRGKSGDSGGVMDRVVSQLLAELDGLVKSCDVFVIGATNRPDLLDPALLRPGRFDKLVYVGISATPAEQLTVLQAITRKFDKDDDCDLKAISKLCHSNLTGADLYSLCAEAMTNAIERQIGLMKNGKAVDGCRLKVSFADFELAVKQTTPSLSAEEIAKYELVQLRFSMSSKDKKPKVVDTTKGNSKDKKPKVVDTTKGKSSTKQSQ